MINYKKKSFYFLLLRKSWSTFSARRINNEAKTAGIIVIGDEILKGDVVDTNSSYMLPKLHQIGVKVKRISVVGDDLNEIKEQVLLFSSKYNYVITSGGIGPTHDDVTFEAVSNAFNDPLILHEELYKLCCEFYKTTDYNYSGMKLAKVPKSSKLTFAEPVDGRRGYPNVNVNNVFIFPGIPQLFQKSFNALHKKLFPSPAIFYSKVLYLDATEDKITPSLNEVVKRNSKVFFGSYPDFANEKYKVKITLESTDEKALDEAYKELLRYIPLKFIV